MLPLDGLFSLLIREAVAENFGQWLREARNGNARWDVLNSSKSLHFFQMFSPNFPYERLGSRVICSWLAAKISRALTRKKLFRSVDGRNPARIGDNGAPLAIFGGILSLAGVVFAKFGMHLQSLVRRHQVDYRQSLHDGATAQAMVQRTSYSAATLPRRSPIRLSISSRKWRIKP